jgi:signal peptidase I
MRKSVTQGSRNGCGIACFAFVCKVSYKDTEKFLGNKQAKSDRVTVKDFVKELNRYGLPYKAKHIKPYQGTTFNEGTIVLIRRSKKYPVGHYLVKHEGQWMDPWINLMQDKNLDNATSGYRKRLPDKPMYAIYPT